MNRQYDEAGSTSINEQVLAKAVASTIRPWLIEDGALSDRGLEGYHHQSVIPRAQPHLARQALENDPLHHVREAIKASANLLSQYEHMWSGKFLEQADPDETRARLTDLLHGDRPLVERIRDLLGWAGKHKTQDGRTIGFNGTIVSYLLAVSDSKQYAFCKPEIYKAAARALLGEEAVVADPVERIAHATTFYKTVLDRLINRFGLPFDDLMHVHIAFYIMHQGPNDYPTWDQLADVETEEPAMTTPAAQTRANLNLILYGPPGTGKTYRTIRKAVEICDGELAADHAEVVQRFRALQEDGRIEFITFHQSYGYEDFVEGIRPVLSDGEDTEDEQTGSEIRYECRDGVFKKLCGLAGSAGARSKARFTFDPEKVTVWKMSLGDIHDAEEAQFYDECIENNCILLGYGKSLDFSDCETQEEIAERLIPVDMRVQAGNTFPARAVHTFKNKMKEGDLVVVPYGNHKFRAIGKVAGPYRLYEFNGSERQMRPVEWLAVFEDSLPIEKISTRIFSQQTIYRLAPHILKVDALRELLAGDEPARPVPYVLVIDEINRGNISKIFGELITLLEPDKRLGGPHELKAKLPYSGETFGVPGNLHVLGTMNTADRSIALLDVALRRRFAFREMMPDPAVVRGRVGSRGKLGGVDVAQLLHTMNKRIELLYDRDHQIGHAYLLGVNSLADLRDAVAAMVIPLLQEYFYGDWSKVCAVLGCPFDPDAGNMRNDAPLIQAEILSADVLGFDGQEDVDDQVRCAVNPAFLDADEEELEVYFAGMLGRGAREPQALEARTP